MKILHATIALCLIVSACATSSETRTGYTTGREFVLSESGRPEIPDKPGSKLKRCLALSGGGIRAATVSYGFLQELGAHEIEQFDLVTAISGGGYAMYGLIQQTEQKNKDLATILREEDDYTKSFAADGFVGDFESIVALLAQIPLLSLTVPDAAITQLAKPKIHGDSQVARLNPFYRQKINSSYTNPGFFDQFKPDIDLVDTWPRKGVSKHKIPFTMFIATVSNVGEDDFSVAKSIHTINHVFEFTPIWLGSNFTGYWGGRDFEVDTNSFSLFGRSKLNLIDAATIAAAAPDAPENPRIGRRERALFDIIPANWAPLEPVVGPVVEYFSKLGFGVGMRTYIDSAKGPEFEGQPEEALLSPAALGDDWHHLGDGGFFNELGLWPSIARGCEEIVSVDMGEDPYARYGNYFGNFREPNFTELEDMGIDFCRSPYFRAENHLKQQKFVMADAEREIQKIMRSRETSSAPEMQRLREFETIRDEAATKIRQYEAALTEMGDYKKACENDEANAADNIGNASDLLPPLFNGAFTNPVDIYLRRNFPGGRLICNEAHPDDIDQNPSRKTVSAYAMESRISNCKIGLTQPIADVLSQSQDGSEVVIKLISDRQIDANEPVYFSYEKPGANDAAAAIGGVSDDQAYEIAEITNDGARLSVRINASKKPPSNALRIWQAKKDSPRLTIVKLGLLPEESLLMTKDADNSARTCADSYTESALKRGKTSRDILTTCILEFQRKRSDLEFRTCSRAEKSSERRCPFPQQATRIQSFSKEEVRAYRYVGRLMAKDYRCQTDDPHFDHSRHLGGARRDRDDCRQ